MFIREEKAEYLIFDKLTIPYTGVMGLTLVSEEIWNLPWPIDDEDDDEEIKAMAEFDEGKLVRFQEYE